MYLRRGHETTMLCSLAGAVGMWGRESIDWLPQTLATVQQGIDLSQPAIRASIVTLTIFTHTHTNDSTGRHCKGLIFLTSRLQTDWSYIYLTILISATFNFLWSAVTQP